jgi:hypothetical protein
MRSNYFLHSQISTHSRQSIISLLILFAFLCTTLSHSSHGELIPENAEQQQCKLCQHNIDTPKNNITLKRVNVSSYEEPVQTLIIPNRHSSLYFIPQLRAPPCSIDRH